MTKLDAKTQYAQSSDIKSRTYLEYRKDMKKKAIAELEVLGWLGGKVKEQYPEKRVRVSKSGGDRFLWFLRKGGISREPDFIADFDNEKREIEFQYVDASIENFYFNFKTSKVVRKIRGKRQYEPKPTLFLCLLKQSPSKYTFITGDWIFKNAQKTVEAAWGSREVYRVTSDILAKKFEDDTGLQKIWNNIEAKLFILNFQHQLINIHKEELSHLLQGVIDENKIVKVIPKDLDSFFKVCFILDNINKVPDNANLWLVYLLTYINKDTSLGDISKITFCIDFLYPKIELKANELPQLVGKIKTLLQAIKAFAKEDGSYRSSLKVSPLEETRYALFSINLLEDLIQDMIYYYEVAELKPIKKIYENIEHIEKTYKLIKGGEA